MNIQYRVNLIGFLAACYCMPGLSASPGVEVAQASGLFGGDESASMQIDIMPDSEENVLSTKSGRVIPLAIMGSAGLDVNAINPGVMLVGKSDKSLCRQLDLNADGYIDLLCDVRTTGFRVDEGDYTIRIKAETYDKSVLRGEDKLKIVRK
jgi:hypothetical protein